MCGYVITKTCLSSTAISSGVNAGDAQPLQVQNRRFIVADIHQSSDFPGETNTFTVTVAVNYGEFPFTAGVEHNLFISVASSAPSTPNLQINCFSDSSPAGKDIHDVGEWDSETGYVRIKFKIGSRFAPGSLYVFAFTLVNGQHQLAQPATIELRVTDNEIALPAFEMRSITACDDMGSWLDSQSRGCSMYTANPLWCDGIIADDLPVHPPEFYAKIMPELANEDTYKN